MDLEKYEPTDTEQFKADLFEELGISKHPLREKFWNFVWELGHAYGYSEVWSYSLDAIELLDTSVVEAS